MHVVIVAPLWATALGIAYVWGADPYGPAMLTAYIIAGLTSFFAILFSEA